MVYFRSKQTHQRDVCCDAYPVRTSECPSVSITYSLRWERYNMIKQYSWDITLNHSFPTTQTVTVT